MMENLGLIGVLIAAFLAVVVSLACIAFVPASLIVQSECLKLGYPHSDLDWKFNAYCVRRVDQTDIVVPMAQSRASEK